MADVRVQYDKADIRSITKSFKAMSDEAVEQSKKVGIEQAEKMVAAIKAAARTPQEVRLASTLKVSKSSKIGEFSFGGSRPVFSGGANAQKTIGKNSRSTGVGGGKRGGLGLKGIFGGIEFGSKYWPQFPRSSGRLGNGSRGYFVYPTLRKEQPTIIKDWEKAFAKIVSPWSKELFESFESSDRRQ